MDYDRNSLHVSDDTLKRWFDKYNIDTFTFQISTGEREITEYLQQNSISLVTKVRNLIPPYELDIYIPDKQIAIEYCGLYWHSDFFRDSNYHHNKYQLCLKKGIRLITIFEDEWYRKQDIVKCKLLNILNILSEKGIYARKCTIISISGKQKRIFLNQTHIQGNGPGSISYGLLYENELVAAITFIMKKDGIYELNRYATSCQVIGGFGKLLNYFKNNNNWTQINTFADLRWHNGNLYEKTGFALDSYVKPTYEYIINDQRLHRSLFMRKFLPKWLGEAFDPNLTEFQNMDRAGILRIWNCGLKKYVLSFVDDRLR
ncbi:MAG: hypothetical protein ACREAU_00625 [Nitrosopumilaceae archaeon]